MIQIIVRILVAERDSFKDIQPKGFAVEVFAGMNMIRGEPIQKLSLLMQFRNSKFQKIYRELTAHTLCIRFIPVLSAPFMIAESLKKSPNGNA